MPPDPMLVFWATVLVLAASWCGARLARSAAEEPEENDASSPPYLEGRIVVCANCDDHTTLYRSPSGSIVCSRCGSPSWCFERTNLVECLQREVIELERSYTLRILPDDLPARGLT
jgi:hypothetical protein